jgi:hypothetical protein
MQFPRLTYEYETLLYGHSKLPPNPFAPVEEEAAAAAAAPQRLILTANLPRRLTGGKHSLYFQSSHVATIHLLSAL